MLSVYLLGWIAAVSMAVSAAMAAIVIALSGRVTDLALRVEQLEDGTDDGLDLLGEDGIWMETEPPGR